MDFSKDTNANWSDVSKGSAFISLGYPENASQRQADSRRAPAGRSLGYPENASQRQGSRLPICWPCGLGYPENASQRQGPRDRTIRLECSGDPANADQVRRYNFKLYPNAAQDTALQRQAALLATLWNAALEQREAQWTQECQRKPKGERKGISKYDQGRDLKLIRAADPEYAAMGSDTMNLCLIALDDAFKAFFKRAKAGAGASSGYPRYKSPYAIENKGADCTIWHREHRKGWRLDRAGKHFKVYAKGIPGTIRARGKFPVATDDLELRDMRLVRVSGEWFCSIVVKMAARRAPGPNKMEVDFDLIDEFARVKILADGQCLPGPTPDLMPAEGEDVPQYQEDHGPSGDDPAETRASDRHRGYCTRELAGDDPAETRASDREQNTSHDRRSGDDPAETPGIRQEAQDSVQSEGDRRFKKFSCRWRRERRRVARMKAKDARRRKEALHRWTTRVVEQASELVVIAPPIKDSTRSARGNEKNHGAAVKPVATLNRHVLGQAPAMAIQMLEYKAAEAGIPFARLTPDEHALAIGRELPMATKAARKASRNLRRMENGRA